MPPLPTHHLTNDVPPMLIGAADGMAFVDTSTVLTRQWFFDGKFLRAEGFRSDQAYVRALVALSNTALGTGVVHGFDVALVGGDRLRLSPGLALTPGGNVVFRPSSLDVRISELLARSSGSHDPADTPHADGGASFTDCPPDAPAGDVTVEGASGLLLLTVDDAGALCGQEERFGALCDDACDTDADRSHVVDGIALRLVPVVLDLPRPEGVDLTGRHLRGRAASAWYARERRGVPTRISGQGLRDDVWCHGAPGLVDGAVPLALLDRRSGATTWVDQWIARREVIETPPARYWAWRMAMRPKDVFLAQVLQFQCQLLDTPTDGGGPDVDDDCREALAEAGEVLEQLSAMTVEEPVADHDEVVGGIPLEERVRVVARSAASPPAQVIADLVGRIGMFLDRSVRGRGGSGLLDLGMLDTPSAGYLPVDPAGSVQQQVRDLFGPGVDLRFCTVRPDFVPEAFWQAQHMERISLTRGLRDPDQREEVDVLVPDGTVREAEGAWSQTLRGSIVIGTGGGDTHAEEDRRDHLRERLGRDSTARREQPVTMAGRLQLGALLRTVWGPRPEITLIAGLDRDDDQELDLLLWAAITLDEDPFAMATGASAAWTGHGHAQSGEGGDDASDIAGSGMMTVVGRPAPDVVETRLTGRAREIFTGDEPEFDDLPPLRARWTRISPTAVGVRILVTDRQGVELVLLDAELARDHVTAQVPPARAAATFHEVVPDLTRGEEWPRVLRALDRIHRARIALKLADQGFRAEAEDRLVGRRAEGGTTGQITATRNWVMFHRRRTRVCGDVVAPQAPVRLRRFLVLHHALDRAAVTGSAEWRRSAAAGFEIDLAQYPLDDELGTVAFTDGGTDLREASALAARWHADGLGGHALLAMELASARPTAETVQRGRLLALEAALPHARRVTPDVRVGRETLPEAWQEWLAAADVDGLVLLATVGGLIGDDPPETRHVVRVLVADAQFLDRQRDALSDLDDGTTLDKVRETVDATDAFDAVFENDEWVNPDEAVDGLDAAVEAVWLATSLDPPESIDVATSVATILERLGATTNAEQIGTQGVVDQERVAVLLLGTRG